ncbi:MAG: TonB-dependent receptor [Lysobacterales bacterium]
MRRFAFVSFLSVLFVAGGVQSQELEEIVVSARKVEENLQDVPISVTAFTSGQLVERGLDDVFDVSRFTPGFSFEKLNRYGVQGGGSRPVIRGMSQILGEPNASIFVDGLQYNDSILSFPFDIVERVEVIKGPQAALFGRATFAGAINLITKRGSNEYQNRLTTRVADYSEYEVGFLSRGPLIEDRLFYTANLRWYDFGGFYRNSLDNQRIGDESSVNFDGSLEYRPNDNFNLRFTLGLGRDDDGAAALTLQNRFFNNCFLDIARQYYCGEVTETPPSEQNLELFGGDIGMDKDATRLALQFEYDTANFTIKSNTGYFGADQTYGYDVDLTANSTALGGTFNRIAVSDREELSTELLLQSNTDSRLQWLAGVYYYRSRRDFREDRLNGSTVDQGEARVDNIAAFGSLSYDFTDRVTGSLELRYAEDEIGNSNPAARPTAPLFETSYDSVSPRVTVNWQITDDSMLYGSYAQGNKPGFINANPLLPPEFLFADEEESDNFEIGAKNVFGDGRFIFNVALYTIDWSQQQLTTQAFLTDGRPASVVVNAGKTTVNGLEMEFTGALTDQWTVGGGIAWTDATFDEFDDSEQASFTGGNPSVEGNQTPNAPEFQGNLFARYEFPVGNGWTGFVRSDYAYTSKKYAQIFNFAHSGSQNLVNLRAGIESGNWTVSVFVDNALDDLTPSTVIRFVDFANILPRGDSQRTSAFVRAFQYPLADPRQWGVTASYNF